MHDELDQARSEAIALNRAKSWPGAVEAWERVALVGGGGLKLADNDALHFSVALRNSGDLENAETMIAERLALRPGSPALLAEYAEIATAAGDDDAAIVRWRHALPRLRLGSARRGYMMLIKVLRQQQRIAEAESVLSEGLAAFPKSGSLILMRAKSLRKSGQWQKAMSYLEAAIEDGAVSAAPLGHLLAEMQFRCGALAQSRSTILELSRTYPADGTLAASAKVFDRAANDVPALLAELGAVAGRPCIVFGSAPEPKFIGGSYDDHLFISCNASSKTLLSDFGRSPDFSFINGHAFMRDSAAAEDVRAALSSVPNLGKVIVITGSVKAVNTELVLHSAKSIHAFPWLSHFLALREILDASVPMLEISTGAFAVMATLLAGARSVELVGFSLADKGHSYNSNGRHRGHVASDAALFALLSVRGFDIRSSDPVIGALCRRMIL